MELDLMLNATRGHSVTVSSNTIISRIIAILRNMGNTAILPFLGCYKF